MLKQSGTFIRIIMLVVLIQPGCGDKSGGDVELSITSHKSGQRVYRPLPLKMRGRIKNFSDHKKEDLHIYLIEQSTRERIWHIEPRARIDNKGNWSAVTWLGNPRVGKYSTYNVCVFASPVRLKLNDGDHPVKEKPEHNGEFCIKLKRRK
jgi:hypothetical protein